MGVHMEKYEITFLPTYTKHSNKFHVNDKQWKEKQ